MSHSNVSVLNTKEPVRFANKLIKKTTDINYREYLQLTNKNLILANITMNNTIRYDTKCYFNVRSKADISQLNLPHGTDN